MSVLLLLFAFSDAPSARAGQTSGTVEIGEGDYYGWRMDIVVPSQVEVEITSSNNSSIDVLVMDQENYTRFSNLEDFAFIASHSVLSVANFTANMTILSGTVYIIVDNSDRPGVQGAATPSGPVNVEYWLGTSFDLHAVPGSGNAWLVYVILGAVAVTFVVVVVLTRMATKQFRESRRQRNS
jgi:hypothetical protein